MKIFKTIAPFIGAFLFPFFAHAVDCALTQPVAVDGDVFYADQWNDERTNLIDCINARLEDGGGPLTGDLKMNNGTAVRWYSDAGVTQKSNITGTAFNGYSGADINLYSDAFPGATLKFAVDGATGDFGLAASRKFYLDGAALTGNTYFYESAADIASLVVGGNLAFSVTPTLFYHLNQSVSVSAGQHIDFDSHAGNEYLLRPSAGRIDAFAGGTDALSIKAAGIGIPATNKIYVDGVAQTGDTYIYERVANEFTGVVGGTQRFHVNSTAFFLDSLPLIIDATQRAYYDSGGDTYDVESGANVLDRYTGGVLALRTTATTAVIHTNSTFNTSGELLLGDVDPPTANYANRNGIVKGWVKYKTGTGIEASYNVSSVTVTGGDTLNVFWNTDFASNDYVVSIAGGDNIGYNPFSVSAAAVSIKRNDGAALGAGVYFYVMAIGDQ